MSNDTRCKGLKPCGFRIDNICWYTGKCKNKKIGSEEKERRRLIREENRRGWGGRDGNFIN
jgi:hypothetical protein